MARRSDSRLPAFSYGSQWASRDQGANEALLLLGLPIPGIRTVTGGVQHGELSQTAAETAFRLKLVVSSDAVCAV